jgi:hypothetical protein
MRQIEIVTTVILSLAVLATGPVGALAQAGPGDGRETLARALQGASLPLERGLTASAAVGIPLSGKYEIDDGAFQLSVYTWKGDAVAGDSFTEVIVDYSTGNVSKVETITDDGDLAAAQSQKTAMTRAKRSLAEATAAAVRANAGYRAVIATPSLESGAPVAEVTLVKGDDWKVVTERLD